MMFVSYRTLQAAWECLKSETMQIAQEHKFLSNSFSQQASKLGAYINERKATRKQVNTVLTGSSDCYYKKHLTYMTIDSCKLSAVFLTEPVISHVC